MGGISLWQLLIILAIVLLLFGTKRLRSLGSDLGSAVKGFKNSVSDNDADFDEAKNVEDKSTKTNSQSQQKTEQKDPQ